MPFWTDVKNLARNSDAARPVAEQSPLGGEAMLHEVIATIGVMSLLMDADIKPAGCASSFHPGGKLNSNPLVLMIAASPAIVTLTPGEISSVPSRENAGRTIARQLRSTNRHDRGKE